MGLRINEGKINPILEKRQICKPIIVCGVDCVYLNTERAHSVIRKPRRAHMPHAYLHMNLKCADQPSPKEIRPWAIKN